MFSFAFCLFTEERKKKMNRKINTQKNYIDRESNQESLDHQSCILPLHWCIRWGITTERVFLNNGDYLNYNVLILQRHRIVCLLVNSLDPSKEVGLGSPLAACSVYGDVTLSVHTVNNFSSVSNYQTHVCLCIRGPYARLNRKINTQKNCIDPESNQKPLDHQSCILPLHWCIRWGITTERVFLNNGDYPNFNVLILQRHRIVCHIIKLEVLFVCLCWGLSPSQQFFSHVGTEPPLPG